MAHSLATTAVKNGMVEKAQQKINKMIEEGKTGFVLRGTHDCVELTWKSVSIHPDYRIPGKKFTADEVWNLVIWDRNVDAPEIHLHRGDPTNDKRFKVSADWDNPSSLMKYMP